MPGIMDLSAPPSASGSAPELSSESPPVSIVESPRFQKDRPYVVAVEGNIGCGKSTLMDYFKDFENAETVPEPIEKWTNLNGHNALNKPVVLLERSLYSMRYVFVEQSFRSGDLHGLEYEVLSKWFNYLVNNEHLPIDLFVYLRAEPSKCYERLRERDRKEEVGVPYSLIERLHEYHESWLIEQNHPVPAPVLILDANVDTCDIHSIYDQHRSKILFGHT